MLDRPVRVTVSFDPGWKNFAAWKGYRTASNIVRSLNWGKFDITNKNRKPGGVYAQIVDTLEANPWMWHDELIDQKLYPNSFSGVVETQEPHNVPARIVATAIYCFLRAKGVPVKFSGAYSKSQAKELISSDLCLGFDQSLCTGTAESSRAYYATKASSYEVARAWADHYGSIADKDLLARHSAKRGPMKGDDIAEAFLLGYAELCVPERKKTSKCKIVYDKTDDVAGDGEDDEDDRDGYGSQRTARIEDSACEMKKKQPSKKRSTTTATKNKKQKKTSKSASSDGGVAKEEQEEAAASVSPPKPKRRRKTKTKDDNGALQKQQHQQVLNFRQGLMVEPKQKDHKEGVSDDNFQAPMAAEQDTVRAKINKLMAPQHKHREGLMALLDAQ